MRTVWLCLVAALCLAATFPPLPKVRKRYIAPKSTSQGAGALALITKQAVVVTNPPREVVLPWLYPKSIDPSNYWWNIQTSKNLNVWFTWVTNASGEQWATNNKVAPMMFFRLQGRLTQ